MFTLFLIDFTEDVLAKKEEADRLAEEKKAARKDCRIHLYTKDIREIEFSLKENNLKEAFLLRDGLPTDNKEALENLIELTRSDKDKFIELLDTVEEFYLFLLNDLQDSKETPVKE